MTVLDYLDRAAAKTPDKVAVADEAKGLTFGQLLAASRRVGTALAKRLGTVNEPVAVLVDRNVESVCAFLGVAASRNFYVPIDSEQPAQRVQAILQQMRPAAMIVTAGLPEALAGAVSIPVWTYEALASQAEDGALLASIRRTASETDPLFAICTSGSTGVPKGVVKSHRSVMSFIPEFAAVFGFTAEERFGSQAPFDFDVSVKDIYTTLYCGASMYILPRVCFSMPKLLMDRLEEEKITAIVWAVSALCVVAGFNAFRHRVPSRLKKVLFSGEVMPVKMLNVWRAALPEALFVNLYGPTEATGNCLYYVVDRDFSPTEKLPLGIPFPNQKVLVLRDDGRPAEAGQSGEICILGPTLALGYYRDRERTEKAFVQNPLNDRWPERMYRTGDMAERTGSGEYYFAARKDFQIKHMGHRIELEEIELHLGAAEGVTRASCLFDEARGKIVAYYTGEAERLAVIEALKKDLPKYMLPNIFIRVDALPMNKNGKIDRQKLREMYEERERDRG